MNIPIKIEINSFFSKNLHKFMFKEELNIAISYTLSLIILDRKATIKTISLDSGIKLVDISYYLSENYRYWDIDIILDEDIKQCENDGLIILDSFVIAKENTTKSDARNVYSSCQKRVLKGQEYLVMIYVKAEVIRVIGIKKLETRPDMINKSIKLLSNYLKYRTIKGVRADSHFFHEQIIYFLRFKEVEFISKPRRDSKWGDFQLKEYTTKINKNSFRYYPKEKLYAKAIIVESEIYGLCKILIVKTKYNNQEKGVFYVVSTNLELSVREILKGKKQRWQIEVIFRDCSQNLGLRDCQSTSKGSILMHIFMVFQTYNYLSSLKEKYGGTIGRIKRRICDSNHIITSVPDILKLKKVC